jgi:TolA-binding protein
VGAVRTRIDELQARLAETSQKQNLYLQHLAIHELDLQKQRIETYQVQARYELAAIYDKAANAPGAAAPGAAAPGAAKPDAAAPKAQP